MISNYNTGGDPARPGIRLDSQPAATVTTHINRNKWALDRPATTICAGGGGRLAGPGRRDWSPGSKESQFTGDNATQVTVEEAGVLQSFPHDYPWRGTKTKRYEQVGNAIPPLLAAACLAQVL